MFGCSMIPEKLRRFLECENVWMQNSSYWKSFDWLQQRINNNLGKFSDPSAVLSFPTVCCHMVQSDRACSLSRCWLLYLALPTLCLSQCYSRWYEELAVIWQISACRGQHGRIRHTSLSLSPQFSQEHYTTGAGWSKNPWTREERMLNTMMKAHTDLVSVITRSGQSSHLPISSDLQ